MTAGTPAGDISRLLAAQIRPLCAELLRDGRQEGAEWSARCPWRADHQAGSFKVRLSGPRAGVWSDFATGERGDALDLVAMALFRGEKKPAIAWAAKWLGLAPGASAPSPAMPPAAAPDAAVEPDADAEARRRLAARLFLGAEPRLAGTPAADYLAARGIDLGALGRQPRSLRFHPGLHDASSRRLWPAMLAAVTGPDGAFAAVHRTWLGRDAAGIWRKAPIAAPKRSLGTVAGGTIRLWRGASGKSLRDAAAGETVVIGEGIETCLSIALACPELRVLSAVSLGNMARVALPPAIATVILAADNDGEGTPAAEALQRAVDRFAREGRAVRIARSPVGKDFNDLLLTDAMNAG
jgi:hypothetical protein